MAGAAAGARATAEEAAMGLARAEVQAAEAEAPCQEGKAAVTAQESSSMSTFGAYNPCHRTAWARLPQSVLHSPCGSEHRCPIRAGTHSRTGRSPPPCPCTRHQRCKLRLSNRPPSRPTCSLCSHRYTCPGHASPPSGAGPPGHAPVLAHLEMTAHSPSTSRPPAALRPRGGDGSLAVLMGPEDLGTSSGVRVA